MPTLKKLIFAPIFLITFAILVFQLFPIFKSFDFIFSLSLTTFLQLILLSGLVALSSLLFVLFSSFSQDWKLVLPVIILASSLPLLYADKAIGFVLMIGIFATLTITYLSLENSLKSYLSFLPSSLLGPSIRHLASLLILVVAIAYFLSINKIILNDNFQIPDYLIDNVLKVSQPQPDPLNNLLKQTVNDQLNNFLKPYLAFIPAALALLLFLTLQSLYSLINIFIYPLLWFIFFALEKSGFVKFTTEMRPVKKMII